MKAKNDKSRVLKTKTKKKQRKCTLDDQIYTTADVDKNAKILNDFFNFPKGYLNSLNDTDPEYNDLED